MKGRKKGGWRRGDSGLYNPDENDLQQLGFRFKLVSLLSTLQTKVKEQTAIAAAAADTKHHPLMGSQHPAETTVVAQQRVLTKGNNQSYAYQLTAQMDWEAPLKQPT